MPLIFMFGSPVLQGYIFARVAYQAKKVSLAPKASPSIQQIVINLNYRKPSENQ